jgi:PHP family Zn ribbon phosphoesterase
MDYTQITLGQLLSYFKDDNTIQRNATAILKRLQSGDWYYLLTSCTECKQRIERWQENYKEVICTTCGKKQ